MDITLNDKEIKKALVAYVQKQGLDIAKCKTAVNISAGRGDKGISATIEISEPVQTDIVDSFASKEPSPLQKKEENKVTEKAQEEKEKEKEVEEEETTEEEEVSPDSDNNSIFS